MLQPESHFIYSIGSVDVLGIRFARVKSDQTEKMQQDFLKKPKQDNFQQCAVHHVV